MEFADKCLKPALKISRKENNHILKSYLKFLTRYNMKEKSRIEEHFEKHEDNNGLS